LLTGFGFSKFPCPEWFVSDVEKLGLPLPFFFAWAAVLTESFGAVALALGFGTRIAGFLLLCTMLVAVLLQKADAELWEKLPSMGFIWIACHAMALGSGRFGLDFLLFKPKSKSLAE
jgi:putative oxidoreductase